MPLLLIASSAVLDLSADRVRAGQSQPMRAAAGAQIGSPPDLPQGGGPRATSGEPWYDVVAVAQADGGDAPGILVAARGAPPGAVVEVTEIERGRTILALVGPSPAPSGTALLSPAALRALGITPGAGVRVRLAVPDSQDQTALRSGAAASARMDAPEVLLTALRKRVPNAVEASAPPHRAPPPIASATAVSAGDRRAPAPAIRSQPRVEPPATPRSGYVVQVAALSVAGRADTLAKSLGGHVVAGGGLYRVQLGPYGDIASAKRGRDEAARRGYRDARISHIE